MKLPVGLLAGILLFLPAVAGAKCPTPGCTELTGVFAVGIHIWVSGTVTDRTGLSVKSLRNFVLEFVHKNLPRIKVLKGLMRPSLSVEMKPVSLGGKIILPPLGFTAKVHVTGYTFSGGATDLWVRESLFSDPPTDVKIWIEDALTAFAADWYRANPGK
ncbi:MAG: hypothetical protein ACE5JS_21755 [Nitrospinota bacterium]